MTSPFQTRTVRTQQELNAQLIAHGRYVACDGGLRAQLAHGVLDGLNLANRQLTEADFSGASLIQSTLQGSNLTRASLYCADLRGADLQFATLTRADIRGASLSGATLSHAVLDEADLRAAKMLMYDATNGLTVLDRQSKLGDGTSGSAKPHGVDFSNCILKNASFSKALLEDTNFTGALMQGVRFKGASLTNPTFKGAVLSGVNLSEFDLPAHCLEGCVLDITQEAMARVPLLKATLCRHQDWVHSGGRQGERAIFDGEDLRPLEGELSGRVLSAMHLQRSLAIGVSFAGSHLQAANFDGADLRDADFSDADLRGASFRGAKLTHARFDGANLGNLPMANGDMLKPDLTGAEAMFDQFVPAMLETPLTELGFGTPVDAIPGTIALIA